MHRTLTLAAALALVATACGNDVGIVAPGNQDQDDDGYDQDLDCNDTDPTVFPGAQEIGDDGVDQDCDGTDALTEYGHRGDLESTFLVEEYIVGNQVTVLEEITVTDLGLAVRDPTESLFRLALYASDGGRPSELVLETAASTLTEGVNLIPVLKQLTLEPGEYWLMGTTDAGVNIAAGEDEFIVYTEFLFSESFPDPMTSVWDYEGPRLSFFMVGEIPAL